MLLGAAPTIDAEVTRRVRRRSWRWADELRRLGVRANADIPRDAKKAREFGAEGIGLCRTEHMFFAEDRLPHVVRHDHGGAARARRSSKSSRDAAREVERAGRGAQRQERAQTRSRRWREELRAGQAPLREALAKLLPFQRADFRGLFEAMDGFPVTIRTLDPPLHEFLPKREESRWSKGHRAWLPRATRRRGATRRTWRNARYRARTPSLPRSSRRMPRAAARARRGAARVQPHARATAAAALGITYPEITAMQARAIFEAAVRRGEEGRHA